MDDHFDIGRVFEIGKFDITRLTCRSTRVCELLSNNSPSVEDKSLVLCARDLIFTTYLQTVNYYSTIMGGGG